MFAKVGGWLNASIGQLAESVSPLFHSNLERFQYAWRKIDEEYGKMMAQNDVNLGDQPCSCLLASDFRLNAPQTTRMYCSDRS